VSTIFLWPPRVSLFSWFLTLSVLKETPTMQVSLGFRTGVRCWGMTVDRKAVSFIKFSAANRSPLRSYKTSVCLRVRCCVIHVFEIWRGPQLPIFLKDFVGGVTGGLLGSGGISLRPTSKGRGSGRVVSPSKSFCSLHMTTCTENEPPRSKANFAWVHIPSQTRHVLQRNHTGVSFGLLC